MTSVDTESVLQALNDEELAAVVRARADPAMASAALKHLVRRPGGARMEVFREVLESGQVSSSEKRVVATALRGEPSAAAQEMLIRSLHTPDQAVLRRVAQSLGYIGDGAALQALEGVQPPADEAAARALQFARSLIAYRLRTPRHPLDVPSPAELLQVSEGSAIEIRSDPDNLRAASIAAEAKPRLPALPLNARAATLLSCGTNELLVSFREGFIDAADLATLTQAPAQPIVMLKKGNSAEQFYPDALFFTQPARGRPGTVDIVGTRPSGHVIYGGSAVIDERGLSFELRSVASRYAPAVDIQGAYDPASGAWRFSRRLTARTVAVPGKPLLTAVSYQEPPG